VVLGVAAALADGIATSPITLTRDDLEAAAGPGPALDGGPAVPEGGPSGGIGIDLLSVESDHPGTPDGADFFARVEPQGGEGPLAYLELAERFFGSVLATAPDESTQKSDQTRAARELADALDRTSATEGKGSGRATVFVRLPFEIPGGGSEALWVEVTGHDARTITGRIADEPLAATDVERGQTVTRARSDVQGVRVR
jgi:uncharacterized protein YegJ (DUF2314 family)